MATIGGSAPYAVTQRVPNNQTGLTNTSTSASFVDIDATKVAVTVVTTGGDLEVTWAFSVQDNTGTTQVWTVAFSLDGAAEVSAFPGRSNVAGIGTVVTLSYLWQGLAAGSHIVKGRWKITGGDTIAAGGSSFMTAKEYRR
jgi:hypothetical protein